MKMTLKDLENTIKILKSMQTMLDCVVPKEARDLYVDDKKNALLLYMINLSDDAIALEDVINSTLSDIDEMLLEIYTNVVDERESFSPDSTSKRALLLDEIQMIVSSIRNEI